MSSSIYLTLPLCLFATLFCSHLARTNSSKSNCFLNSSLVPKTYHLDISPEFHVDEYSGKLVIEGFIKYSSNIIKLHSGVNITTASFLGEDDQLQNLTLLEIKSFNESVELMWSAEIPEMTETRLLVEFSGVIREELGIYASTYKTSEGTERKVIATEFEPTYARYAFPCIDEPHFKAKFNLRLRRPKDYSSFSNAPLLESQVDPSDDGWLWDTFEETPPMPTYTFTFVICDYIPIESGSMTIWVPKDRANEVEFAARLAPLYLEAMENFTGVNFSLPKLHHITVPKLRSMAMENWGLIMYREEILLLKEGEHTINDEIEALTFIAHEIAHQWFGNLVTCESWAYIWLNEGIATYLQSFIANKVFPSTCITELYAISEIYEILFSDSVNPEPLTNMKVCSNEEIFNVFSSYSYHKGSAIIKMTESIISMDALQMGLQNYLVSHAYDTVTESMLWESLEDASLELETFNASVSLSEIMTTWTHNEGYPLLTVTKDENGTITVQQELFQFFRKSSNLTWWIPLSYTTSYEFNFDEVGARDWLEEFNYEKKLGFTLEKDEWIVFNIQRKGYYRVNYDIHLWGLITDSLKSKSMQDIHPMNRAQLIDDVFTMAASQNINYSVALNLSEYLINETHYYPWSMAIKNFDAVRGWLNQSELWPLFKKYLWELVHDIYLKVTREGFSEDDLVSRLMKVDIVEFACNILLPQCMDDSVDLVLNYLRTCHDRCVDFKLPVDLRENYLCSAVKSGNEVVWKHLWEMFQVKGDSNAKIIVSALACTENEDMIAKLLEEILLNEKSKIMKGDVTPVLAKFDNGKYMCRILDFISDNYEEVLRIHGKESMEVYIETIAASFLSQECKEKTRQFIYAHNDTLNEEELLDFIPSRNSWIDNHSIEVNKWLSSRQYKPFNWNER